LEIKEYITFLCADFINTNYGENENKDLNTDIILGNNFGDICGIINGKFKILTQKAHTREINCLKIIDLKSEVQYQ